MDQRRGSVSGFPEPMLVKTPTSRDGGRMYAGIAIIQFVELETSQEKRPFQNRKIDGSC
jgi:hypothetical protein